MVLILQVAVNAFLGMGLVYLIVTMMMGKK
jgi:hypothetical protein